MCVRRDTDIKKDIEWELRCTAAADDSEIAIEVDHGEVTLSGFASDYLSKYRAEIEARRIRGVVAVANDIVVKPLPRRAPGPQTTRFGSARPGPTGAE